MESKAFKDLMTANKVTEDIIAKMASLSIKSASTPATPEMLNSYVNENKGILRVYASEIKLNGSPIKEESLSSIKPVDGAGTSRFANLKSLFTLGKTPCFMSTLKEKECKWKDKVCYLKVKIAGDKHKDTCIYCYECFHHISILFLNAYIKDKKASFAWKCACKEPIAPELFMITLQKELPDAVAILDNKVGPNHLIFCVNCSALVKTVGGGPIHTGSVLCPNCKK
jgi:hypothetical protein